MDWQFLKPDSNLVARLKQEFNCSEIIAKVIANRGVTSLEESRAFFNPTFNQFHDPFLMKDMDLAVERIIRNINSQTPILIFGDYDVDGTTGASMLFLALQSMGASVSTYIPDREVEGYGLSKQGINYADSSGIDLIITCDCGINAFEQVAYATTLGIDVIITDHHVPDDLLPVAKAVLNPKRPDCDYPFKGLCGGGVALKLAMAIAKKIDNNFDYIFSFLDLITLGTAADIVPILDENRIIVHYGVEMLKTTTRPGLKTLLKKVGLSNKVPSVGQLVFNVAPKINAAGRMGDANRSVELLTTSDIVRANELADELVLENHRRQEIQQAVLDDALRMVNAYVDLENERAIVLAGYDWHPGVVGIVASKLKEKFHRPAIIIAFDKDGRGKGSARSINQLDLYEALSNTSEHLEGFGGHPMAAGLMVIEKNLKTFQAAFVKYTNEKLTNDDLIPSIIIDGEIKLTEINGRFMSFLNKLGPYGPGNMRPKFVARGVEIIGNPKVIGNGDHVRFRARQGRTVYSAVGFNMSHHYEKLITGLPVDLAFLVEVNEWQGQSNIQLNVRDIKLSERKNRIRTK